MRAAAENLTPITLELGGTTPAIIDSSANLKDSAQAIVYGKLLNGGQTCIAGNIIVRQRGTRHNAGLNVGIGKDHTIYALIDGTVVFRKKRDNRSYVSVLPAAQA